MGQQHRFNREYYPPPTLGSSWESRSAAMDEGQCSEQQHVSGRKGAPPEPIQQVLRNHAQIPVKSYYLFCILEDGKDVSFCTPNALSPGNVTSLSEQIKHMFPPNGMSAPTPSFEESIPFRRSAFDMKPTLDFEAQEVFNVGSRVPQKRRREFNDVQQPRSVTKYTKPIMVKDSQQLGLFYEQRFKNCQQAACKVIAKIWIKTVEPKKQSNHPYTGKDGKAPDWWPKKTGNGPENSVRHKEPDHLYKRERLILLGHILRMVMEPPSRQHPDIKKLQLNVTKLEEVTMEALGGWFADGNSPSNASKRPYLEEIFKIAKQEERFLDGLIDGTARVHVSTDERLMDGNTSDTDEPSPSRLVDVQDRKSISRSLTPHGGLAAAPDLSSYANTQGPIDEGDQSVNGTYMSEVMMRGHPYGSTLEGSDFHEDVGRYGEVPPMPNGPPLQGFSSMNYIPTTDPIRRPVGETQPDFPAVSTATGSFDHWATTSSPNSSAIYSMNSHAFHGNAAAGFAHPAVSMAPSHNYPICYDGGIPRSHDLGPPPSFGRLGPMPPAGYHDYGQTGLRSLPDSGVKQETYTRTIN